MSPLIPSPNPGNLLVGAGVLFVDRFDSSLNRTGWRHMGNVSALEITSTPDIIKKYSSMSPMKSLYDQVVRRNDVVMKATLDEHSPENAALHLLASETAYTQAATAVVGEAVFGSTVPGSYFFTAELGPISAVTVTFGSTPGVLNTDYAIIDAAIGLIQILPGTAQTGAVTVSYTPTAILAAGGAVDLAPGFAPLITAAFKFVGNPTRGRRRVIEIWQAMCTPDGAHDLITDDYGALVLNAAVLTDLVNHPTQPLYRDRWIQIA